MKNAQREHSAILLTFIKLLFVIKIFVLTIFEWLFYTGFSVILIFIHFHFQSQERNSTPTNKRADHEILTETKDPSEGIKRPYTSLIDKEIARERSLSRSSRGSLGSRSRSVSPGNGRPKFAYPDNLAGIGPLHEPVASSTHKSLEIRAQMSNNLDPDSPRSSLRGSSIRGQSPVELEKHSKGHVAFNDRTETNEEAELYSPNIGKSRNIKDPEYAGYYKNLTSSGRKKELLKQRQVLLDEQERLRVVLKEQEDQLKRKHLEYEKRKQLQKERMEFYEKGDKFPPLKLNFDADSEKGFESDTEKPGVVLQRLGRNGEVRIDMYTPPPPEVVQIGNDMHLKSLQSH